jgi:hypothetical protein
MRRFCFIIVAATVLSLLVAGLGYLAMLASIPYQRPTGAMAARDRDWLTMRISSVGIVKVAPERDWTLKIGRGWYGLQSYPWGTRLVVGARSTMIRLPFLAVTASLLGPFVGLGMFFWCRAARDHDERSEAQAA